MPIKKRDPHSPDFPHGTRTGYKAGCGPEYPCPANPTCSGIYLESRRDYNARKRAGVARRYKTGAIREYVRSYLDKGWTISAFADAANVSNDTLLNILGGTHKTVLTRTARALMAVDEEALADASHRWLPAYTVRWKVGSLMANGWALDAQATKLGYQTRTLANICDPQKRWVTRELYDAINTLFDRFEDIPGMSKPAREEAARLGFLLPHQYAPDGTPESAMREEADNRDERTRARWADRDTAATTRLEALWLTLGRGRTLIEAGELLGINPRVISRYRVEAGLTGTETEPDQEERVAEILAVLREWQLDPTREDPYESCRRLGMMPDKRWAAVDNLGKPRLRAA